MLKYYNAYSAIRTSNPKESYFNDYNAIVQQSFSNTSNIFYNEIEFEYDYGSNIFIKIPEIRVDSVLDYNSSMVINGDDFKTFQMKPGFPRPTFGMKFRWGKNYWLVINTNNEESIDTTVEVRKCNNVLRFFDQNGNKIYEPCILDTTLRFTKNENIAPIIVGHNEQKFWCQRNSRTTLIKANDRFLFGPPNQRVCFRVYGAGLKNGINSETMNDNSPSLTEVYLENYQINPEFDDLTNGFANAYVDKFSIQINDISNSYNVGQSGILGCTVYKGNNVVSQDVSWSSSNSDIVSIDNNGNFSAVGSGSATISVTMTANSSVSSSIVLSVVDASVDNYEMVVDPSSEYILQGNTINFSCYLYKNGEKLTNACEFKNNTVGVPQDYYNMKTIDSNHFSITNNKMYMSYPIIINCSSGEYSFNKEILLKGV